MSGIGRAGFALGAYLEEVCSLQSPKNGIFSTTFHKDKDGTLVKAQIDSVICMCSYGRICIVRALQFESVSSIQSCGRTVSVITFC